MDGIPDVVHLRSFSLFGLSDVKLIFDDDSDNDLESRACAGTLEPGHSAAGRDASDGHGLESCRTDLLFHLRSTNPAYDPMELKSLEDWVVEKNLKSVPNVVDVASFGGPTREYQVRLDPNNLVSYGLNLRRWSSSSPTTIRMQAAASSKTGLQQINVRDVGLVDRVHDIEQTVILRRAGRHCA